MLLTTAVLKPLASACTLYTPGFRLVALYTPALLVLSVMVTLVLTLVTFTEASGTMAPLGSVTTPLMVPNNPCAAILEAQKTSNANRKQTWKAVTLACLIISSIFPPPDANTHFSEQFMLAGGPARLGRAARIWYRAQDCPARELGLGLLRQESD